MARLRVGVTCPNGHFNYFGDLWEPIKDKDVDKLAERSALPANCSECGVAPFELPHVEGRSREADSLARVGGQNVRSALQARPKERPPEGPLTPAEWKRRVFDYQRERLAGPALCLVTREPLSFAIDDAHHCLEKSILRARGLHEHVWDERNGIAIKARIHAGQTSGLHRIPAELLPDRVWQFARELGPWATARIREKHPTGGRSHATH